MTDVDDPGPMVHGRTSSGVWGAAAGAGIVGIILAYFLYAHLYLWVSNEDWPPPEAPDLPLLRPALLLGLAIVTAAVAVRAGRPLPDRRDQLPVAGLVAVTALLGVVGVVAGVGMLEGMDLDATARAHDASVLTLHAIAGATAAAGVVISGLTAYEAARVGDHPWVAAATVVGAIWWSTVAIAWLAIAAVVYAWPQLT